MSNAADANARPSPTSSLDASAPGAREAAAMIGPAAEDAAPGKPDVAW